MSKAPAIEVYKVTSQEVDQLLKRVRPRVDPHDFHLIERIARSLYYVQELLLNTKFTLKRVCRWLFGAQTEKSSNILNKTPPEAPGSQATPPGSSNPSPDSPTQPTDRPKRKGHGRNGVQDYTAAEHRFVALLQHKAGDPCPDCHKGKLHKLTEPAVFIHIVAQPFFTATAYDQEKVRCGLCGAVFTAKPPPEAGTQKYDPNVGIMLAVLRYGTGLPFYRIDQHQKSLGVPMPATTQWELVEETSHDFKSLFQELMRQAAQAPLLHNDDTGMTVLSLKKDLAQEGSLDPEPERTGVFTSCIVAITVDHQIALYFTGHKHAGENLNDLLKLRDPKLPPPIQMCDALSRNVPKDFATIMANCNSHSRRGFVDVEPYFPQECRFVLESFRELYRNEAQCKEEHLSPEARLAFHQEKSKPIMEELSKWMQVQVDNKLVEPNSGLGKAIAYMRKHWEPLTLFLRKAGAPLDNNLCERVLKMAILHRKNSMFYRTEKGAAVGDMFMSIINTCRLVGVNPFDYMNAIRRNARKVSQHPEQWLPWNYKENSDTS